MSRPPGVKHIVAIWAGWVVLIFGFQAWVTMRLDVARPDYARSWTPAETRRGSQAGKRYLNEPFLNTHVSWDSEFYLAIALDGYESDHIRRLPTRFENAATGGGFWPFVIPAGAGSVVEGLSLNYAFFPFYPFVMRLFYYPLTVFGLNAIATMTLAGVVVSCLGALAGMLALYDLARDRLGEHGALRAAFYLIVFPSGFFLAQVYTEGLFVGLAFTSLALIRRDRLGWAALLAVFATLTRAAGIMLVVPLFAAWFRRGDWRELDLEWGQVYFKGLPWKTLGWFAVVLAPFITWQVWRMSYFGLAFFRVEEEFFGRGILSLAMTFFEWRGAWGEMFGGHPQAAAYYMVEWFAILLGFTACIREIRHDPGVGWFGLLVVFFSFFSGPAQGMHRYILAAPPVFLFLSRRGANPVFDRVWTAASVCVMAILALLFSYDMWTG